jgi:transcriptional regulator with XRE-family HTH domain
MLYCPEMGIGENIRRAREAAGLTQRQLAKRVGVTFQSVNQWESGGRFQMERLPRIAMALKTTVARLYGLPEGLDPLEQEVIDLFRRESPQEQARMLRILRATRDHE